MSAPTNDGNIVKRTSQYIDNTSFDETTAVRGVAIYGTNDGTNVYRMAIGPNGEMLLSKFDFKTEVDSASSTVTYIGYASPGSAKSSAIWKVKKIDTSSGVEITYADGNGNFDNVWDNRASLSYS